jgi:hypothetical protein
LAVAGFLAPLAGISTAIVARVVDLPRERGRALHGGGADSSTKVNALGDSRRGLTVIQENGRVEMDATRMA